MLSITVPYFSLPQIYESGQCCLWKRFRSEGGHRYLIPIGEEGWCVAKQQKDTVWFYCTSAQFFDTVFEYMDFGVDYRFVNTRMRRADVFARRVAERNIGVHVLRQPMWHALLSIILSRGATTSEARKRYSEVASRFGEQRIMSSGSGARYLFHDVPRPHSLLGCYEALRGVLRPDVADALSQAAQDYCDGWYGFSESDMSYRRAQRYMAEFGYLEPLEREKLLSYGFHYGIAYPVDGWARKLIWRSSGMAAEDWFNKKLVPLYGYEGMVAMYFQAARIKEEKRENGTDR